MFLLQRNVSTEADWKCAPIRLRNLPRDKLPRQGQPFCLPRRLQCNAGLLLRTSLTYSNLQNGNITDPPVAATTPNVQPRFAHIPCTSASPPAASAATITPSAFCATCLKNQNIVATALRDFEPPHTAGQPTTSAALNAAHGAHRAALESRYPPVCTACAPRVRERLRRSVYTARTDHLRRMVERTRGHVAHGRPRGALTLAVLAAGRLGWLGSVLAQMLLHGLGIAMTMPVASRTARISIPTARLNVRTCTMAFRETGIAQACAMTAAERWMPMVLCIGLLTMWWHNRLAVRCLDAGGRFACLTGLGQYYALQAFAMLLRIVAYVALVQSSALQDRRSTQQALHIFMIVFLAVVSYLRQNFLSPTRYMVSDSVKFVFLSSTLVKLDQGVRVSFNLDDSNLFHDIPPPLTVDNTSPPRSLRNKPARTPFAISDLAPVPPRTALQHPLGMQAAFAAQPDDNDEMDWMPSISTSTAATTTNNFNPRTPRTSAPARSSSSIASVPTPFHGTLPAAPLAPAAAMLRANPSTFRKATPYAQAAFADLSMASGSTRKSAKKRVNDDDSDTDARNDDDNDANSALANGPIGQRTRSRSRTPQPAAQSSVKGRASGRAAKSTDMRLRAPRFFAEGDGASTATGLEDMMQAALRVDGGDDAATPRRGDSGRRWGDAGGTVAGAAAADREGSGWLAWALAAGAPAAAMLGVVAFGVKAGVLGV